MYVQVHFCTRYTRAASFRGNAEGKGEGEVKCKAVKGERKRAKGRRLGQSGGAERWGRAGGRVGLRGRGDERGRLPLRPSLTIAKPHHC